MKLRGGMFEGDFDSRKMEPVVHVLDRSGYTPHQNIVQCIAQYFCKPFRVKIELKSLLHKENKCDQDMLEFFEVYAISQIYDTDFIWWINGIRKIFAVLKQFWLECYQCSLKQCNFDKHENLNKEFEFIDYYMTKVLNFNVITKALNSSNGRSVSYMED
jgi:hypothetical protein